MPDIAGAILEHDMNAAVPLVFALLFERRRFCIGNSHNTLRSPLSDLLGVL
jgi:hypothetical protein